MLLATNLSADARFNEESRVQIVLGILIEKKKWFGRVLNQASASNIGRPFISLVVSLIAGRAGVTPKPSPAGHTLAVCFHSRYYGVSVSLGMSVRYGSSTWSTK